MAAPSGVPQFLHETLGPGGASLARGGLVPHPGDVAHCASNRC